MQLNEKEMDPCFLDKNWNPGEKGLRKPAEEGLILALWIPAW